MIGERNVDKRVFLLTGPPGCGKTTTVRRTIDRLEVPAGGFFTQEIRTGGRRVGFRLITLDGRDGVLAHVDNSEGPKVSKYRVDIDSLDSIGVDSLRSAMAEDKLVVVDEIGPMEMYSRRFREAVRELLEGRSLAIGSIVARSTEFGDEVKAHPAVKVLPMNRSNRDEIAAGLAATLKERIAQGG